MAKRGGAYKIPSHLRPIPMSLPFVEDRGSLGTPSDMARTIGARVVLDCETTGLQWWRDRLVGVGVYCPERGIQTFVPCLDRVERERVLEAVQDVARCKETTILAHNVKFDMHFLRVNMWEVPCAFQDTMLMAHLIDSRQFKSLGALERKYLQTDTKAHFRGEAAEVHSMPLGVMADYAINDCRLTWELAEVLWPEVVSLGLERLFRKDTAYTRLLHRMEHVGLPLDLEYIQAAHDGLMERLKVTEREFMGHFKRHFNWRSDAQLSRAIYDWYGWPKPKNPYESPDGVDRTRFADRGMYNKTMTNGFVMTEKAKHPLAPLIVALRECDRFATDTARWLGLADPSGAVPVLHPGLKETGTRTGRLSASPNVQNIASDTRSAAHSFGGAMSLTREGVYNLREGFVARPGHTVLSVDHKQQEMKLFAVIAQIPEMLDAIRARMDIHGSIANDVWGDDIRKDPSCLKIRREWSKTIGFALLYGGTTGSLKEKLNMSFAEADAIAQSYWRRFPRIKPFLKETIKECDKRGFIRYWSGRIWREDNPEFTYKGTNAQVQGGAADLISIAAMRCQEALDQDGSGGRVMNIVHDEILFEVPTPEVRRLEPILARTMEVEDLFDVPFQTDSKAGPSYGQLTSFEKWDGDRLKGDQNVG